MRVTARQWITDWRSITAVIAAILVGLLAVLVITSITDRENALQVAKRATANEQAERTILNRRVDQLLAQIDQLESTSQVNAAQLAVLRREIALLQQQIRDLGGQPVVIDNAPAPRPSPSRSPASPRPTPTRSTPSPSPSPTRTCIPIVNKCITEGVDVWRPNKAAKGHLRLV